MQLSTRLGGEDAADDVEKRVRQSLDAIKELDQETQALVRRCYQVATTGALAPATVFLVFALLAAFFIRERRLG